MIPEPVAYRIGLKREPRMRGDDPDDYGRRNEERK